MLLLDTEVMIDLQRRYPPALSWFASLPEAPALPGPVVLELMQDCADQREMAKVQSLVGGFAKPYPKR